ncbi:MAG: hypothetical protein ABL879_15235 [Devosia sp.]
MSNQHTLTRHRDIQNWVAGHQGMPAVVRRPSETGRMRSELALHFSGAKIPTDGRIDQAMSPVSWAAWLSEFDRRQLALRVGEDNESFEFVTRKDLN